MAWSRSIREWRLVSRIVAYTSSEIAAQQAT
jgi:hypothetical protein